MNAPHPGYRRKRILVDRDLQLNFSLRLGGAMLLLLIPYALVILGAPALTALIGGEEGAAGDVRGQIVDLVRVAALPVLCTFAFLFAFGVKETFRIAGPAYRFGVVFRDLKNKRLPRGVRIRNNDYLQDTARDLDEALSGLHDQVGLLQHKAQQAVQDLEIVAESTEASASLQQALRSVQELQTSLQGFELVGQAPECLPIETGVEPNAATPADQPVVS